MVAASAIGEEALVEMGATGVEPAALVILLRDPK
jgi:hypothetical protein